MKKVKTYEEHAKILLDSKIDSIRDPIGEPGFTLETEPPDWATPAQLWDERRYNRKIEGWYKLCMEAYFVGWIDYFDEIVQGGKIEHTIYFHWTEELTVKEEYTSKDAKKDEDKNKDEKAKKDEEAKKNRIRTILKIYLDPSSSIAPLPPKPIVVEKPPPPPMS